MFKKQLENKLNTLNQIIPDTNGLSSFELEFVSNFQVTEFSNFIGNLFLFFIFKAIQTGVRNTFGYVRASPETTTLVNSVFV